jgi:hypothetical protein
MLCAAATALLIAPAAFHRVIYRRRLKQHLVRVANRMGLLLLGRRVLGRRSGHGALLLPVRGERFRSVMSRPRSPLSDG